MSTAAILPTTSEGQRDREISPGVWLITDPTFYPEPQEWRALANVGGALAVVVLRVYIASTDSTKE